MITHIIFDNNGVLTTSDRESTYECVSGYLGISAQEVIDLFSQFVPDLDKGKTKQRDFYFKVLKKGGFDFPVDEFMKVHLDSYTPKPDTQSLAKELSKNYKISLLSNFGDAFWSLFEKFKLDKIFSKDNVFVSSDLGMAKPDKAIYLRVLDKLGVNANNVIFIDDNLENVDSAKDVGLNAIPFRDKDSLVGSLGELGVTI